MIGAYGPWAAPIAGDGPARLSFRNPKFAATDLDTWRRQAGERFSAGLLVPETGVPRAELQHQFEHDGLTIEHLRWSLPSGPPTEAYFLKPAGALGRLPGVLAFHDHGGWFDRWLKGWRSPRMVPSADHPGDAWSRSVRAADPTDD
jgi:hypothetical protein